MNTIGIIFLTDGCDAFICPDIDRGFTCYWNGANHSNDYGAGIFSGLGVARRGTACYDNERDRMV
ncbi:MAG: hypothetical protein HFI57_14465 [Lachnospiraceae bacterium]|nr:hypothetical protein [Lachnospiraceae bacterium]